MSSRTSEIQDHLWHLVATHDVCDVMLGVALIITRLGFVTEGAAMAGLADDVACRADAVCCRTGEVC